MSAILSKSRSIKVPSEFATDKLSKVLELYLNWYDGDIAAAKVALIQDVIELGDSDDIAKWHAGILDAIRVGNG